MTMHRIGKILANYTSKKDLISKKYKEISQLNKKTIQKMNKARLPWQSSDEDSTIPLQGARV